MKLKNYAFRVVNLYNGEMSLRYNPLHTHYITSLGDATEVAEVIISALLKRYKSSGGN